MVRFQKKSSEIYENLSKSLSYILSKNKTVKYYIKIKTHKLIVL